MTSDFSIGFITGAVIGGFCFGLGGIGYGEIKGKEKGAELVYRQQMVCEAALGEFHCATIKELGEKQLERAE